jgi:hypothetical protein
MANAPKQKVINRRHVARLERERQQQRWLIIGSIAVGALVVLIILFGVLNQRVFQPSVAVARVDGEKISVTQFQDRVRFTRQQMIQQLNQLQQMATMFGDQGAQYFGAQIDQINSQLNDPATMGTQVLDQMVNEIVIRQEAEARGITVSEADVDKGLQEAFGYYANGTPTPQPELTLQPTSTLSALQMTLMPPTATPTATVEPTADPSQPTATLEPTLAPTATADPNATAIPTEAPLPTATAYTEEGFNQTLDNFVTGLEDIDFSENDLRGLIRAQLYQEKLFEAVTADVTREQEMVWARHILVTTEEEAQAVIDRLNAGEDFAAIAAEVSLDTSNKDQGGDLQWFTRERMVTPFSDAAFAMEVGEISAPVQTEFGYHVIQVLGKEVRQLDPDSYDQARQTAFNAFLEDLKAKKDITREENITDLVPNEPAVSPLGAQ